LLERKVAAPIAVVPTGIDVDHFAQGNAQEFRRKHGIPERAWVIGHSGRLAREKNLEFLVSCLVQAVKQIPKAHVLIVGEGAEESTVRKIFDDAGLRERLHLTGMLKDKALINAYHAMDTFAFASVSETQGVVLTEAMAAQLPVVALDAP